MLENINTDELVPGPELDSIIARLMGARILVVPFSIDIGTAWPLVERFRLCVWPTEDKIWLVFQDEFHVAPHGIEYYFDGSVFDDIEEYTFRATAPWAICVAVIKLAQQGKINNE